MFDSTLQPETARISERGSVQCASIAAMLLVIFGAGASHGCSPSGHSTLPLTNDLFNPSQNAVREASLKFPQAGGLISHARRQLKTTNDLEKILEARSENAHDPQTLAQLLAMRYWLTERILFSQEEVWVADHTITHYSELIDQLGQEVAPREPIVLVTFNYDTLLDSALAAAVPEFEHDRARNGVRGYVTGSRWTLLRPHGSAGWSRVVSVEGLVSKEGRTPFGLAKHLDLRTSEIVMGSARLAGPVSTRSETLRVPAIAVPVLSKARFEMPPEHGEYLAEVVRKASRIVAVGWRGREGHMRALLKQRPATTPVIFADPSQKTAVESADAMRAATGGVVGVKDASFQQLVEHPESNPMFGDRHSWSQLS